MQRGVIAHCVTGETTCQSILHLSLTFCRTPIAQQAKPADAIVEKENDDILSVMESLGRRRAPTGPYSGSEVLTSRLLIVGVVVVLVVHCFLYLQVGILLSKLKLMDKHVFDNV